MNTVDDDILFVEENSKYRFCLKLENEELECRANIEIFPPGDPSAEEHVTEDGQDDSANSHNANTATVDDCLPRQPDPIITPPELIWFLQQNNIVQTIDYAAIYDFCAAIETGLQPEPTIMARGIEPVSGDDGWFELTVKISGEEAEFKEDKEGNVDLRTRNAFSEIEPDQKLGIVHPPAEGISGITVQGLPIPAASGHPFELIAGEGVVLKYNNRIAFATKSGRALLEKNTLSVVDQLIVPGDVDLSIGNIDFHGFVEIKGEVPDDFSVTATKGIQISGPVGACHLESAGSIEITSMAGKGVGEIVCHGDLRAKFLNQVSVIAFGDVEVANEIRNCRIKSTGKIVVERGGIIGGKCTAMDGIEAKILGTDSGQKTRLVAGVYFPDVDRFEYLREQLHNIGRQIKSINDALGPLKALLKKDRNIAEAACQRLRILNGQLVKLHEDKDKFNAEIAASKPQEFSTQNPKINVLKSLKEGVCITLGESTEEIKIARSGPMSIIENTQNGGLRFLSLTAMSVAARQIEEEILIEQVV